MNTLAIAAAWPRVGVRLRQYGIAVSTCILLGACVALDASWRETLKTGLAFLLGAYPLCRLLQGPARRLLYGSWIALFAFQTGIKAFLTNVYDTEPDTVLVIESISNTNIEEVLEFLRQYAPLLLQYLLASAALLGALLWARPDPAPLRRQHVAWATAALLIFAGLHFNPTFRESDPVFFWPTQWLHYAQFQDEVAHLHEKREMAERQLPQWAPVFTGPAHHTVAVIIGESTSRWDWQLYGYARATTPRLMKETRDAMVFRDVISGACGTVASFRLMLTPAAIGNPVDDEAEPSVVMLAKAAGYKTFWISNQHDRFINTRYAEEADVVHLANTGGGRSDRKLDEDVLPYWDAALKDPAPRKMIFVHLLGAHAHYDLRSPSSFHQFSGRDDAIMKQMRADGRSVWVRMLRNSYDNAMLYQDFILSRLLHSFKTEVGAGGSGAFLYTPDHGEEVGHTRDFAGHSLSESGAVVPMIAWTAPAKDPATRRELEQRPFQTDRLNWTILDLARIQTRMDQPQFDLFSPRFTAWPRRIGDKPYAPARSRHD